MTTMKHPTITKAPDLEGRALAWQVALKGTKPDHQGALCGWLVYAPWAHAFWHTWSVCVVHLRPIDGAREAIKRYPEAEFEFLIVALDPASSPDPDHPEAGFHCLEPIDVVEQFHGTTDADAIRLCEAAVRAIVEGKISPDQDYRGAWCVVVANTADHFRRGMHKPE